MYSYSFPQWLLFFFIYCVVGWCIESTIVSVSDRRLTNRGFLRGPMLPIYGFGAIVILFATLPVRGHPFLVYVFGMAGTTALELVTGWLMEKTLKMKYWDYTGKRFNFKGYICLTSSLFWGVLSLFLTDILHTPVEKLVLSLSAPALYSIDTVISVIFTADLINSVRTALDVNKLLSKMESLRVQIELAKMELEDKIEQSEQAAAVRERIENMRSAREELLANIGFFKKNLILSNPSAHSAKFNAALTELKEKLRERTAK